MVMKHLKNIIKMKTSALLHRYFDERPIQLRIGQFIILTMLGVLSFALYTFIGVLSFLTDADEATTEEDNPNKVTPTAKELESHFYQDMTDLAHQVNVDKANNS